MSKDCLRTVRVCVKPSGTFLALNSLMLLYTVFNLYARNHEKQPSGHQSCPKLCHILMALMNSFKMMVSCCLTFLWNLYPVERFCDIILLLFAAVKTLLFWIIWEWAILDKHIFWVLAVVWFPQTPSNFHSQYWGLSNLLSFSQSLLSASKMVVSQSHQFAVGWCPFEDLGLFQMLKSIKDSFEHGGFTKMIIHMKSPLSQSMLS